MPLTTFHLTIEGQGFRPYSSFIDISMSKMSYELITLQPAFHGKDRNEILRKIAVEPPRAPRKLNPGAPRELETIVLKATRERVWRAISDSARFGRWFGVEIDGPFAAGKEAVGRIAPTKVDPEVARLQEPYRGTPFRVVVERIDPLAPRRRRSSL